ncbi:MAG: hypothetical protein ACE5JV_00835, partial [Nitrososphaerales archaeon]
ESVLSGMAMSGGGGGMGAGGEAGVLPSSVAAQGVRRPARGSATCKGLIEELWAVGWFGSERNLSEVHEELARRGYNYDRTAVSHSLTDLVRENVLTRVGSMRAYRYIQKRPPQPPSPPPDTADAGTDDATNTATTTAAADDDQQPPT